MQNKRYFDNAATTAMSRASIEAYVKTAEEYIGNPSSSHAEGIKARKLLEECRESVAKALGAKREQIYFTSGASEAISIVLSSLLRTKNPGEVIFSSGEHEAVLSFKGVLEEKGWRVKIVSSKGGFVQSETLSALITKDTRLVAVQFVNNVIGSIMDLPSLVKVVREKEKEYGRKIFFFTDAVQALCKIPFTLDELDADGASFSSHKICGPRGVGVLYLKNSNIQVISKAGGQEKGIRGGTENLPAIKAFETALSSTLRDNSKIKAIHAKLRSYFENNHITILSPEENCSPYILSISTPLPSEVLTRMLSDDGYSVSSGSACSNNVKGKGESTLIAMGYKAKDAKGAIRISFCFDSEEEEAVKLASLIVKHVKEFSK